MNLTSAFPSGSPPRVTLQFGANKQTLCFSMALKRVSNSLWLMAPWLSLSRSASEFKRAGHFSSSLASSRPSLFVSYSLSAAAAADAAEYLGGRGAGELVQPAAIVIARRQSVSIRFTWARVPYELSMFRL